MTFFSYMIDNSFQILGYFIEHIQLTLISVTCAILIGIPIGIIICYVKQLRKGVLGFANLVQAIPSIAFLGFMIPILGIGKLPTVVVVTIYSLLPIIKNTVTGIVNINPDTLEAANGIGMTKFQILYKVEIPLALPVIMAGVRISAVTTVGLMTMGGLIGGGGLGFLIYSGIRTLNNSQILSGAIPACILALFIDYICGIIETLVVAKSLQTVEISPRKRVVHKVVLASSCVLVATTFLLLVGGGPKGEKHIKIGNKGFTEQVVVTQIVAQYIEDQTDIEVSTADNLGGTQVLIGALENDDIDMYIEYTGTAYTSILGHTPISDVDLVYDTVVKEMLEKSIVVLPQMGFNNTYTLTVKPKTAEKYNLTKISDIKPYADSLRIANTLEFKNREDGLPGLEKAYNMHFLNSTSVDGTAKYLAIDNDEVDVIDAFATDGLVRKYNLVSLEDDLKFFPPYYAIPMLTQETYEKYPELEPLLAKLGSTLDNSIMAELNYRVDDLGEKSEDVAHSFLVEYGFIDK